MIHDNCICMCGFVKFIVSAAIIEKKNPCEAMHVENVVIAHSEAVKDIISVVVCSALCSVGCGCVSENVSAPFVRAYKIIYQSKLH